MKHLTQRQQPLIHWTPRHDQVVMFRLYGMSYDEIATATGYSRENVRTVLHDPRAQQASEVLRKRILGGAMSQIEERMGGLGIQALKNISDTINAGSIAVGTHAKKHQDNVSFELLSRIGFGRRESEGEAGGIHLPKEEAKQLVAAIEKSNTARRIVQEAEVAEFVEVNAEDIDGNGSGTD